MTRIPSLIKPPFLPGYNYESTKLNYHKPHTLVFKNGFRNAVKITHGIGGEPVRSSFTDTSSQDMEKLLQIDPEVIYGIKKRPKVKLFVPKFVTLDNKVLKFKAYFLSSTGEHYDANALIRRNVIILYYLIDDTISITESIVDKVLTKDNSRTYTWRDLNLNTDIYICGITYKICDCDAWTKEFLLSRGLELNEPLKTEDLESACRKKESQLTKHSKAISQKRLKRYPKDDSKTLRFYCFWDDPISPSEVHPYIMQYFLSDDTVEVKQVQTDNKDPHSLLLKRQRLPKNYFYAAKSKWDALDEDEFYTVEDFGIGRFIDVYGRKFVIYDCDEAARDYCTESCTMSKFEMLELPLERLPKGVFMKERGLKEEIKDTSSKIPPKTRGPLPKLEDGHKFLRYEVMLDDSPHDEGVRMILRYYLSDSTIQVNEFGGSRFLKRSRVAKPNAQAADANGDEYYGPCHFLPGADLRVLKYYKEAGQDIPDEITKTWEQFFLQKGLQWDTHDGSVQGFTKGKEETLRTEYLDQYQPIQMKYY